MTTQNFRFRFLDSISELDSSTWNGQVRQASPFLRYEFFQALEETGCTTRATGWQPCHLAVSNSQGRLIGAVPLFEKTNSYGEYVFDWSWADAYRSNGLRYYPKLLTAVPFTPSTGPRLLFAEDSLREELLPQCVEAIQQHANELGHSSWHVLFPTEQEHEALGHCGLLPREGCQFHWFNRGYTSFDDFLDALSSRKRKNIRKERLAVASEGIEFMVLDGAEITAAQWQQFYGFYQSTYLVRGMQGYLSQDFFRQIGTSMPDNLLLVLARKGKQIIAGALFFHDRTRLFGRYWGSLEQYQFLHFETCFYQGIDYCIRQGLKQFDAGAQGEHKIQRGFEPIRTVSSHWIGHPAFADAIGDFLDREQDHVRRYREEAASLLPYKKE